MRTYHGAAQWKEWILECRDSGMEIKTWCSLHDLSDNLFFRWRKRLIERGELEWDPDTGNLQINPCDGNTLPQVLQVNLPVSSESSAASASSSVRHTLLSESIAEAQIMIETPVNGCHIYVGSGFSQEALRKVMEVVK